MILVHRRNVKLLEPTRGIRNLKNVIQEERIGYEFLVMQRIAVGMVMIHFTVCNVSTKQLLKKFKIWFLPKRDGWTAWYLSCSPLLFQDMMSWTQLHCVLRSYLAKPLENPSASFVDNCVRAVWMKQLKLSTRGQRNNARNACSDEFYWLYLNPTSSDTLHQCPVSSPGHIYISGNYLIQALQLPSPHSSSTSCHVHSHIPPTKFFFRT